MTDNNPGGSAAGGQSEEQTGNPWRSFWDEVVSGLTEPEDEEEDAPNRISGDSEDEEAEGS